MHMEKHGNFQPLSNNYIHATSIANTKLNYDTTF
jgi:hypothetical protein